MRSPATAHALAVARWGVEPCGGQVAVTWAHMGAGINARSHVDERRHPRPVDLLAVLDHLQPRHRLGLAQAVHGHRARARPPRRPRARQRPAQRDVALLRLPDAGVRRGPAGRPAGRPAPVAAAQVAGSDDAGRARRPSARSSSARWSSARRQGEGEGEGEAKATAKSAKARAARAKKKAARSRSRAHARSSPRPLTDPRSAATARPRAAACEVAPDPLLHGVGRAVRQARGAHWASARSPSGIPSGVAICGVSRRYHSASSAAWHPEPAAVTAWR